MNTNNKEKLMAVILAGGKGTRLGYETKNIPKPLVKILPKKTISVADSKFLEYQDKDNSRTILGVTPG